MDRSKRTALVVGVAAVLAAVASLGMYRIVSRMPAAQAAEMKTVGVVVAQHPLKLGTRITADHVKLVQWPANAPVANSFSKLEDVLNRGLISTVDENEPLTQSKLAALEAGAGLPPSIPPGMRAISLKVNEVVGVAGFVVPGTHVDVMVTLSGKNRDEDSTTRVVLSNAQVLTAGTRYDQEKAKDGAPIPSTVVTLLVTPDDGERVALAAAEGQIMLTLRNPLDQNPTFTNGVRTAALLGRTVPEPVKLPAVRRGPARPPSPVVAAATAPAVYTVEAIRGAKRSQEIVR
jgi:pilus assembly protein CpaB